MGELLQGIRLLDHWSEVKTVEPHFSQEFLVLRFSMPQTTNDSTIERSIFEWKVLWTDIREGDGGRWAGAISCPPFCEDPPYHNWLGRIPNIHTAEGIAAANRLTDKVNHSTTMRRDDWDLKWIRGGMGIKAYCETWRRAVGIKPKDIAWPDVARSVCAAVGVAFRDCPDRLMQDRGQWVFQSMFLSLSNSLVVVHHSHRWSCTETMVRMRKQFSALRNPDTTAEQEQEQGVGYVHAVDVLLSLLDLLNLCVVPVHAGRYLMTKRSIICSAKRAGTLKHSSTASSKMSIELRGPTMD